MAYEGPFFLGILLVLLGVFLWGMRRTRSRDDTRGGATTTSLLRRYAAFESEENALLVPVFLVLGTIGIVFGAIGLLSS